MSHWRLGRWFYAVVAIVCANVVWGLVVGLRTDNWQHMWMALATVFPFSLIAMLFDWARNAPRHQPGQCLRCGYERIGLDPSARCPECGEPAPPVSPAQPPDSSGERYSG